jgi:hypothetical protein
MIRPIQSPNTTTLVNGAGLAAKNADHLTDATPIQFAPAPNQTSDGTPIQIASVNPKI